MIKAKRFELKTGETNLPVVDFFNVIDRDVYNALGQLPVDFSALLGMLGLSKVEDLLSKLYDDVENFLNGLTDGLEALLDKLPPWVKTLLESIIGQALAQFAMTEDGQNLFNQLPADLKEKIIANILKYTGIKLPKGNCNLDVGTLTNDTTVKDDLLAAAIAGVLMTSVGDCGNPASLITRILLEMGDSKITRLITGMLLNYFIKTNNLEGILALSKLPWFRDTLSNFPFIINSLLKNIYLPNGWTMKDLTDLLDLLDPNWGNVDKVSIIRKLKPYRTQEFFLNQAAKAFPDTSQVVKLRNTVTDVVVAIVAFSKARGFSDRFIRHASV